MTDKELAAFGERLYEAVLLTPLPAGTILGLATAIRYNASWSELPRPLRFAVFKIAAVCLDAPADHAPADAVHEPPPAPPQATGHAASRADENPLPGNQPAADMPGAIVPENGAETTTAVSEESDEAAA